MEDVKNILNPEQLLRSIGISGRVRVADFGCGPGIFALEAARMTRGTVYCFDVLPTALEALQGKARMYHITNIVAKRVNLEQDHGSGLPDHHVHYVMMRKILLQNTNKNALFAEARRILREDGTVLVVGWTQYATIGPELQQRLTKETVKALAEEAGLSLAREIPTDRAHYALTFTKKS